MDPLEVGMRMPFRIMKEVCDLGLKGKDLVRFGVMMDVALMSVQLSAVENGLDAPASIYRSTLKEKLQRLGMEKGV